MRERERERERERSFYVLDDLEFAIFLLQILEQLGLQVCTIMVGLGY
jgi:hypothetical protein